MRINAPKSVLVAVLLILAVHANALWPFIMQANELGIPLWQPYTAIIIPYALLVALLFFILMGRTWARTIYTVFAAFGLVVVLGRLPEFDLHTFILWTIRAIAVVLLYIPMSDSWFTRQGTGNSSSPNLQS